MTILLNTFSVDVSAFDIEAENDDGVTICYNLINDNTELEVVHNDYSGTVNIPKYVIYDGKTYTVTSIGKSAFYLTELTSITIPNSVTSIGDDAFYLTALTSITIPNSVTSIGKDAFPSSLKVVTINSDKIVSKHYGPNSNIRHIFGENVIEYILGDSVKSIGTYAFAYSKALESITISNGVNSIGHYAFLECEKISSLKMPNSISWIGNKCFGYCTNLHSVTISNNLKEISDYAFEGSGLCSITIPNGVVTIGDGAFQRCYVLDSVTISASVRWIEPYAFNDCQYNLKTVITADINNWCKIQFQDDTSNPTYYAHHLYDESGKEITEVSSSEGVGPYAFYGCTNIKSIKISGGNIGNYAFCGCNSLRNVTLGKGSIGENAFKDCNNIRYVNVNSNQVFSRNYFIDFFGRNVEHLVIGNDVTTIKNYYFHDTHFRILTIGSSVSSIGSAPFTQGSRPYKIIWLPTTPPTGINFNTEGGYNNFVPSEAYPISIGYRSVYKSLGNMFEVNNILYVPTSDNTCDIIDGNNLSDLHIGKKITYKNKEYEIQNISQYAFVYSNLSKAYIDVSGKIGKGAFAYCNILKNIIFSDGVKTISESTFDDCKELEYCELGSKVDTISNSFWNCSKLRLLKVKNPFPPICNGAALSYINKELCSLSVPKGMSEYYRAAEQWKDFSNINDDATDYTPELPIKIKKIRLSKYATFYDSRYSYNLPNNLSAKVLVYVQGAVTYYTLTGGIIPRGTPVILVSNDIEEKEYTLTSNSNSETYTGMNLLRGSDINTITSTDNGGRICTKADYDYLYYKLSYGSSAYHDENIFGWYWGNSQGEPFYIEGGKAWLVLPKTDRYTRSSVLQMNETTSINNVNYNNDSKSDDIYNIYGSKVNSNYRGIIIKGGKKILKK